MGVAEWTVYNVPVPSDPAPSTQSFRSAVAALRLTDFRNYDRLSLRLDRRPVVLTGQNGAGKTNLLEAISFLSPGRGLRRARLDAVARNGGIGAWAIAAAVESAAGPVDLGTGIGAPEPGETTRSRSLRVNHAPARSSEALLEYLRVIWLTPALDGLFTGPASDRRRFLDRMVLSVDRNHGTRVNAFERAMRGRNRLLEQPGADAQWLSALETEMAEIAVAIAAARIETVSLLSRMIGKVSNAAFPAARIAVSGQLETELAGSSATEVEDRYRASLGAGRRADAAAGRTLAGPHLSDLSVIHAPKNAPAEICSTGEQKALLIGLTLAQARLTAELTGETPIILLDEIAAHLDAERRAALFATLLELGAQAWMTGTDRVAFDPLGDAAQFLSVRSGSVEA
jgi:DNA replication and repair protein RecF